jgi:5-hydroxyisourate hydrolase-like protein (transthyretin family)
MKFLLVSSLFLIALATPANGCSCAGRRLPCEAYWDASAVFVGTVTFSTTTKVKESGLEFNRRLVRFHVDRQFSGVEDTDVEVLTGFGDADCGYNFRLGGQYLVYAYRNDEKILSTSICTRTRLLSEATADLEYIRGLSKAATGGTISGEVQLRRETEGDKWPLVKDVRLLIEGTNKHFEAKTDRVGKYSVSGLPAGTYKVRIDLPEGLSIYNSEVEVKVHDRGCAQAFFFVEPDTRITGRVLDNQGIPVADVMMELVPVSREGNAYPSDVKTDKEGRYALKLVKPGRYHFGVRIAGRAGSTYVPFPQTYYPGVSEQSQATVISITEGQLIELNELVLPPRFIERTLNGIVVDSDGKPVAGAVVWLKERQYDDADMPYRRETDSEGRFSYPVYEGIKYELNANVESAGQFVKQAAPLSIVITSKDEPVKLVLMKSN